MNKTIDGKLLILFTFIFVVCGIFWKGMPFWEEPRLWAEEGAVYLKSAFENGWKTILMPQLGYYAIIPSMTTYFASLGDIKYIPFWTQNISLFFWMVPFVLIVLLNREEFTPKVKSVFMFALLLLLFSQQEIFLNTINLQFITPIILLISWLYDEDALNKYQIWLLRALQIICLLNGVLGMLLMPFFLYKVFMERKYNLLFLYLPIIIIHLIMVMLYEGGSNTMERLIGNYQYLIKDLEISIVRTIVNRRSYAVLIFISAIALFIGHFKKRREEKRCIISLFISCFLLILFVDFTKIASPIITSRYLVPIYLIQYIILLIILAKHRFYILLIGTTLFVSFVFIYGKGRGLFRNDYSYCKECPKWSEEYKKIEQKLPAEIHPAGWEIKIEDKQK